MALTGIVVGAILEFHFAVSALPEVEWLKVRPETHKNMDIAMRKLDKMKLKYAYLFMKAMM